MVGTCETISSGVMPWCSCHATMSSTRTRWPAMRAFPPQTPEVLTIRSVAESLINSLYWSCGPWLNRLGVARITSKDCCPRYNRLLPEFYCGLAHPTTDKITLFHCALQNLISLVRFVSRNEDINRVPQLINRSPLLTLL